MSGPDRASGSGEETVLKLQTLEERLGQLGSLMVAYSGGVDSAFLAATAHRVLGPVCLPCWLIRPASPATIRGCL